MTHVQCVHCDVFHHSTIFGRTHEDSMLVLVLFLCRQQMPFRYQHVRILESGLKPPARAPRIKCVELVSSSTTTDAQDNLLCGPFSAG